MAKELFDTNQTFMDTIMRLHTHLLEISDNAVNLLELFADGEQWLDKQFSSIGITAVQIGLTNILFELGYTNPDYIVGHSMGEIACSYADGCLTERQCVHISFIRSQLVELIDKNSFFYNFNKALAGETPICIDGVKHVYQISKDECAAFEQENPDFIDKIDNHGRMLFVSATADEAARYLDPYPKVRIACYNSVDGLTFSGPHDDVLAIETHLKQNKVFCKLVDTDGIAYHSVLLQPYTDFLMKQFAVVMPNPLKRSQRWLSTSDDSNPMCDALYHTTNIVSSVLFNQQIERLPKDETIAFLEISPSEGLLGQIKRTRKENTVLIATLSKTSKNSFDINRMRCNLWINKVVPTITTTRKVNAQLPIEHRYKMRWDHTDTWKTVSYEDFESGNSTIDITYNLKTEHKFLLDHQIQGKSLFPAMGHLYTIWKVVGLNEVLSVRDFYIYKAIVMDSSMDMLKFSVRLNNNICEIDYEDELVAKAEMREPNIYCPSSSNIEDGLTTNKHMFYGLLSRYGYEYKNTFCMIDHVKENRSFIKSANHWISFLDGMLQTSIQNVDGLYLPTKMSAVVIKSPDMDLVNQTIYHKNKYIFTSEQSVIIHGLETTLAPSLVDTNETVKDTVTFVPYMASDVSDPLSICAQIVCENMYNMNVLEIGDQMKPVKAMVSANSFKCGHMDVYKTPDATVDFIFGHSLVLDQIYEHVSEGGFILTTTDSVEHKLLICVAKYNNMFALYRKLVAEFTPVITDDIRSYDGTKPTILNVPADGFVKTINKEPDMATVLCAYGFPPEIAVQHAMQTQLKLTVVVDGVIDPIVVSHEPSRSMSTRNLRSR